MACRASVPRDSIWFAQLPPLEPRHRPLHSLDDWRSHLSLVYLFPCLRPTPRSVPDSAFIYSAGLGWYALASHWLQQMSLSLSVPPCAHPLPCCHICSSRTFAHSLSVSPLHHPSSQLTFASSTSIAHSSHTTPTFCLHAYKHLTTTIPVHSSNGLLDDAAAILQLVLHSERTSFFAPPHTRPPLCHDHASSHSMRPFRMLVPCTRGACVEYSSGHAPL